MTAVHVHTVAQLADLLRRVNAADAADLPIEVALPCGTGRAVVVDVSVVHEMVATVGPRSKVVIGLREEAP